MSESCGCNTIRAVLTKSKYRTGELDLVYKDPRFDVYSYKYGDGIWGTSIDVLEGDNYEKLIERYGEKSVADAEAGEEVPVCVPLSEITNRYSLMDKKGKLLIPSEPDMAHMCFSGVITLPDGRQVEPDAPDSPLRKMGLI